MNKPNVHVTFGVNFEGETPYIESTARVIEGARGATQRQGHGDEGADIAAWGE